MFVTPKTGLAVADPERGDTVPKEGRNVIKNQYWLRRLQDGDVTIKSTKKGNK
ncbi:DUF2635 domain-containing protein [Pseudomonadota bacterium]|nr:DUF2635 domain-containing protein [Pseudomonadota bacterium]